MGSRGQNSNNSYARLSKKSKLDKKEELKADQRQSLNDLDEMETEKSGQQNEADEERGAEEAKTIDQYDIQNFDRDNLAFEVIDQSDFQGVYRYQLLDQLGRRWRIVSRDNALEALDGNAIPDGLRFDQGTPTCVWVKDGKAMQLYVEGMNREEFFNALNISVNKLDNTTTLSKRLSRILRPQSIAGHFRGDSIKISHELPQLEGLDTANVWDGGGVVSRQMLLRMIGQLPRDLDEKSRRKLMHELRTANRVEFTVMTPEGQLKGHAMVIETKDALWEQVEKRTKASDANIQSLSPELRRDFYEAAEILESLARENRKLKKQDRSEERRDLNVETEELLKNLSLKHAAAFNETYGNGSYGRNLDLELEVALRNIAGIRIPESTLDILRKRGKLNSVDELKPPDFLVPEDYKDHLSMTSDDYFISFKAPKTSSTMHLDIQSNINLGRFWSVEQKEQWLKEESEIFLHAIKTGDMGPALTRIDPTISPEKLENWPLVEYGSGGGDPNWSQSIVRQLANQHLRALKQMEIQKPKIGEDGKLIRPEDKLSLPIPGGRYYVFPAPIARAAGKNIQVAPGEAYVDKENGTVWVNEEDWGKMKDAAPDRKDMSGTVKPWGLARVLGGMDNDDALWVQEFVDEVDGGTKLLIWRSPNAPGEYAVLNSHQDSNPIPWTRVNSEGQLEEVRHVSASTANLFPRIDHALEKGFIKIEDNNISKAKPNDIETAEKFTGDAFLDSMYEAAKRAHKNGRTLGSYCNLMMIEMASRTITAGNPLILPCATEDVIDAVQKTGADTSKVQNFVDDRREKLMEFNKPIPKRLHQRLEFKGLSATPTNGTDDLSRTDEFINRHRREFNIQAQDLAKTARPPHAVIQHGLSDPDAFQIGKDINSLWQQKYNEKQALAEKQNRGISDSEWTEINQGVISILNEYAGSPQKQSRILAGAWTSAYLNNTKDSAIWALGPKNQDGTNTHGTFHMSVKMLQDLGLLDIPDWSDDGLRYLPNTEPTTYKDGHRRDYKPIQIQGAGLSIMDNLATDYLNQAQSPEIIQKYGLEQAKQQLQAQGNRDIYKVLPKNYREMVKGQAAKMLQNRMKEATTGKKSIFIRLEPTKDKDGLDRLDVITESGFRLGLITKEMQHHYKAGEQIEIRAGIENDLKIFGTAIEFNPDSQSEIEQ
jgi:hypothetical protein